MNVKLPQGKVRSPITGTITKWRVNIYILGSDFVGRLQVLKRTKDRPGIAGDVFETVRQAHAVQLSTGETKWDTSLRIRKGQFIGLWLPDQGSYTGALDEGRYVQFLPPLFPGDPGAKPTVLSPPDRHILLNATVRR
jgi:hypothetical protein